MEVLVFAVLALLVALVVSVVLLLRCMEDADRYRWLRDHPASLVPNDEISRWLLRRPWGAAGMDAVVDAGMGKVERAQAQEGQQL
ncbi:MAG: hypothetical protein LBV14_12145 [Acidovorax sp.]|jgi:hypothetical protein|nr:hypothetical protein [Acidovorax sp.]